MQYEVVKWELAGAAYLEGEKFLQNTNIDVDVVGAKFPNPIKDGCTVDITGKTIDETVLTYIETKCEEYVNQKYNT